MSRILHRPLPLFPLERVVLFPGMALPLHVFEERYKVMIGSCQVTDQLFGVLLIRAGREVGTPAATVSVGCTARIVEIARLPDGRMNVLTMGESRFRLEEKPVAAPEGYLVGEAAISTSEEDPEGVPGSLVSKVGGQLQRYVTALRELTGTDAAADLALAEPSDAVSLSFQVGAVLHGVPPQVRQSLLETDDVAQRLRQGSALLRQETQTVRLMLGARGAEKSIGRFSMN